MAYALVADIENYMQFDFTASTRPTTTQIESFIDQVSGEFDTVLASVGFSGTITDAAQLNALKMYCSMKVCFLIYMSYGNLGNANQSIAEFWYNEVKDWLNKIQEKPELILGLTSSVDPVYISSNVTDGTIDAPEYINENWKF